MFKRNERKDLWKKVAKGDPAARARLSAATASAELMELPPRIWRGTGRYPISF